MSVVCVDELHNLSLATLNGAEVSDTLKYFSERIPATFVHAEVGLEANGAFRRAARAAAEPMPSRWNLSGRGSSYAAAGRTASASSASNGSSPVGGVAATSQ